MEAKRFDEYHKNGCNFYGALVVVDCSQDMQNDPNWGKFGAGVSIDYLVKARKLVADRGYNVVRELLSMPELVVEIK